jgi:hypothetical protein
MGDKRHGIETISFNSRRTDSLSIYNSNGDGLAPLWGGIAFERRGSDPFSFRKSLCISISTA